MHPLLKHILGKRKIEDVEAFLNPKIKDSFPKPFEIPFMEEAVERFYNAISHNEKIGLFGDYDVDGATSVSLFLRFFKGMHFDVYIPNRLTEGYGPNNAAMDYFKSKEISLVVFMDCGTKSVEVLKYGKSLGLDFIVLDHHLSFDPLTPDAIIVNPNAHKDLHPSLQNLCAAGVTFLFLSCLLKKWPDKKEILLENLDLVALGTVCDVMPLTGFNRAIVKQGLRVMNQNNNDGITALSSVAGIETKICARDLGFAIGPRINAGGRIGQSNLGYHVLSTPSKEEAMKTATLLNKLNLERRDIQQAILDEAIKEVETRNLNQHNVLLLGQRHWHPGVIGIVAGRLKDLYNKPTLIVGFNEAELGIGSGRAPDGFSVTHHLDEAVTTQLILAGGGHDAAFGFKLHPHQMDSFYSFLIEKTTLMNIPKKAHDTDVTTSSFENITLDLIDALESLEPYGHKNPEPLFRLENVTLDTYTMIKGKHFKGIFKDGLGRPLTALWFNADKCGIDFAKIKAPVTLITKLGKNTWNEETTLVLHLIGVE